MNGDLMRCTNAAAYFFFQHPVFKGQYRTDSEAPVLPAVLSWLCRYPKIYNHIGIIQLSYAMSPEYHSWQHAVMVADMANKIACAHNLDDSTQLACTIAGLLHDSGHICAPDDADNIAIALENAQMFFNEVEYFTQEQAQEILDAIACTQFDAKTGTFPVEPKSVVGKILRDADLLNCTYSSWPEQITRLALELKRFEPYTLSGFFSFMIDHSAFMGARTSMSDTPSCSVVKSLLDGYLQNVRHVLMTCRFL